MGTAFKLLPKNYLADWGEFESWASGAASAPDGWIAGSVPTLAREATNIKYGVYSARVIGSTAAIAGIYRTVPNGTDYQGRTFSFGVWGKAASTGPYLEINDGVSSKTIHLNGSNAFVFTTTAPIKIDYAATQILVGLWASVNATAYFDGAVLCEGEDLFTNLDTNIAISDWAPSVTMKQDSYEIAQREGSFISDNKLSARNIKLKGSVIGSDVASTRTHFDGLLKSLLGWQTTEKRHLYLYDDRVTDVFLASYDWSYLNGLQWINFNVNLKAPEGTTRGLGKIRSRTVIAATITEFNLSRDGSALSKPVISFIANQGSVISTCSLENLTTGETMSYVGTVPTNIALDIDCDAGTVLNNSVDQLVNFSGDFIGLVRGTNYLRFTGNNCQINIDFYNKYL